MTKMRVHELAKELGMDNKELVDILQKKNVEIKNHMSTIEDDVAEEIRREASAKGAKSAPDGEKADAKEAAAPKKKNLAFVIRPQNSRNSKENSGKPSGTASGTSGPAGKPFRTGRKPSGAWRPPFRRKNRPSGASGTWRKRASGF